MEKYSAEMTGAIRESIGTKIDTTLVPYELIASAAIGLNYGALKYSERNFERGLSYRTLLGSIERHTRAMMDGEFMDGPSNLPHHALLASSVAMLCHNIMQNRVIENLPPTKDGMSVGYLAEISQEIFHRNNQLSEVVSVPTPGIAGRVR